LMISHVCWHFSKCLGEDGDHHGLSVMFSFDNTAKYTISESKELVLPHRCNRIKLTPEIFLQPIFANKICSMLTAHKCFVKTKKQLFLVKVANLRNTTGSESLFNVTELALNSLPCVDCQTLFSSGMLLSPQYLLKRVRSFRRCLY
uniref:Signal peptide protein n=1 Tax=Gongylonema pulchrum TaxID=637853 RepID=A0A183DMV3_9BILA